VLANDELVNKGERSFELALSLARNASEIDEIHQFRFYELYGLGKKEKALDDLLCLAKLLPARDRHKKRLEAALKFAKYWLSKHPGSVTALAIQASVLLKLGEFDEAEADAAKLLELAKDHGVGLAARGTCRFRRGQTSDAFEDFEATLRQDANCFVAAIGKALCFEKMNRPDDALVAFRRALSVSQANWQRIQALEGQQRLLQASSRDNELLAVREQLATATAAVVEMDEP
jgi:tetratricopeptide (TPR) repeat protein